MLQPSTVMDYKTKWLTTKKLTQAKAATEAH